MPKPVIAAGDPCWIDLMSADTQRSMDFYSALLGWTFQVGDQEKYGGYTMAFKDGQAVAGIMFNDGTSGYPDVWTTYLRVADIDETVTAVQANGGQVYMPPMDVPEQGKMAMIGDADGAGVGLWEFGGHTGFELTAEAGAPGWHELFTRKFDDNVTFYRQVFGWKTSAMSDTDEFRYTTLGEGNEARAGIMDASGFLPESVPSNWHVYFAVEDTDAAVATALEHGGQVVEAASDTPFGRQAILTDPTGAAFWVIQDLGQAS